MRSIKDIRVYHRFDTDPPPTIQSCFERWIESKRIVNRRRDIACRIKHRRTSGTNRRMVEEWRGPGVPREVDKRAKRD